MDPLYIDTSTEYELDMSLFPGWHEDSRRSQPKLLVHGIGLCHCERIPNIPQHCDKHTETVATGTIEYGIDTTCLQGNQWNNTFNLTIGKTLVELQKYGSCIIFKYGFRRERK